MGGIEPHRMRILQAKPGSRRGTAPCCGIIRSRSRRTSKQMELDLLLRALELPSAAAPRRTWAELHGGALRLAAAEAAARHDGPVCVIAASAADADKLEREMAFFGPRVLRRFPDYETLPYEPISPPQDLLADRLLALHRLARGEPETLVLEAGALLE